MTQITQQPADASRVYKAQRTALTRAINANNPAAVEAACRAAVAEWNNDHLGWPDDWSTWERALLDAFPWPPPYTSLDDLAI